MDIKHAMDYYYYGFPRARTSALVLDHLDREQKKRPQDFSTALYGQKHLNSNVNEKEATVGLKKFTVAIEDESLLGCLVYRCSTVCINYFCF